ncbi:TetR/AcrR family transcriptional regulator [Streptomyces sp. S1A1-8]|nr:TetR/AcrR family transcriptional regulator [Streptomyces sp. S1D4-20]QDN65478.1 TetR/AcrR family transcriptional regulator [Streptomyces sp. S1D4-14]QDN75830.1 TetR/AcrR family transcriptional regulator [Streptomyces sp. S1A1-7]QDN96117.1 TetR/AcrR family transcriptional regulator [Streptomyces sp. RLB1-9]QDO17822.1 TetR/AcrR family transcriptional regulator [Streptomyces sp. S1A1-8]QDO27949.1 TetR/AcrR family transcriptional regulator [Streptomyces sp. S1A1-3]QDO47885.1 TetR/AcrR family t
MQHSIVIGVDGVPDKESGKMAGVSKSVREAMIEAAWLLIAERGLEGMATREVLARTGAPRGSVYHHFPGGRTELIEAAIDHSRAWMQDQIAAIDPRQPDDVVAGYIAIWRRVVESTDFRAGCATTGAVTGGHDAGILERANAAFDATVEALTALFAKVGLEPAEAASRATLLMYAVEGAVILARARRSVEPLEFTVRQLSTRTAG